MANIGDQERQESWVRRFLKLPLVTPILGGVAAAAIVALIHRLAHLMDNISSYTYILLAIGVIALIGGLILLIQQRKTMNIWKFASVMTVVISGSALISATAAQYASSGAVPLAQVSIRATTKCCTTFYIAHADDDDKVSIKNVTGGSSPGLKADVTWKVVPGLADKSCVSLESVNERGKYLWHSGSDSPLLLDYPDGTQSFNSGATFCLRPGNDNSGQGFSFMPRNISDHYIRHYAGVVYVAGNGGPNPWDNSNLWVNDTTWAIASPWS